MKWLLFPLAFILIIFVILESPAGGYLIGLPFSHVVENLTISSQNITLTFNQTTLDELNILYKNEVDEFIVCFNSTYINKGFVPDINSRNVVHVSYKSCNTLISLHSHPFSQCKASEQDLETLKKTGGISMIMCGENRFSVWS